MCCVAGDILQQTDPDLRSYISHNNRKATAIIPVGSVEQHGPHLPVSVDSDIARAVAIMVAKKNGYMLLPTIQYGVSHEHSPLFNLSLDAESLCHTLVNLCGSARAGGMRHILVINGHHGNIEALEKAAGIVKHDCPGGFFGLFHYWRHMQNQQQLGHAGFAETSMMLAISAASVRMDLAQAGLVTDGMTPQEVKRLSDLAAVSFVDATGNGIWGDPRGANAEAGHRMLRGAADSIAKESKSMIYAVDAAADVNIP